MGVKTKVHPMEEKLNEILSYLYTDLISEHSINKEIKKYVV